MFLGVYWNQPVCPSVGVSVCVQNTSFCQSAGRGINSLPNEKMLDWSKLKAFADDKINVNQKLIFDMEG